MSQPAPVQYYICCGSRELGVHHSACQRDGAARWHGEEFVGYARMKRAVAAAIEARSIVEVGVGYAVAAKAFLSARPEANYVGFDDESLDKSILADAELMLKDYEAVLCGLDSSRLESLPACDLCHVDGCHEYGHCFHDTLLALRAAEWVLVDDAQDSTVAAAVMQACFTWKRGDLDWTYLGEALHGSILIHAVPKPLPDDTQGRISHGGKK